MGFFSYVHQTRNGRYAKEAALRSRRYGVRERGSQGQKEKKWQ